MSDDLRQLAADLEAAGPRAQREAYTALVVEAHAMKDDWRTRVTGVRGLPGLAAAVSYDVTVTGLREITAEIGYDQRGQGELGNIAEFGSSRHGPIRPAGRDVLLAGAQRYETYLARIGTDL